MLDQLAYKSDLLETFDALKLKKTFMFSFCLGRINSQMNRFSGESIR